MQNDPLSHGLWEMTAPPAPPTSPLAGEVRADVAVVGCGYTGLSTALHLAEAGAKVVALEAVEIGFGGAGRNVGLVNAGMWLAPDDIIERLGADYGERLLSLLSGGPAEVCALVDKHGIDCELVRNGTLHCAVGRSGLAKIEERARQWGARGAPVRLLTQAETAKRIGVDIYAGKFSLFTLEGVLLAYMYFQIPLMVLVILPALEGLRPAWREAASNLGANGWQFWRYVGGPVLAPAFLGCVLLLFGSSFSAYATAEAMTAGALPLTAIQIGSFLNGNVIAGQQNVGKALGLGMILIIAIVMIVYTLLQRRAARWLR